MSELVLIRGLPGGGKSTIAKALALVGYAHFEADMFFEPSAGDYLFDSLKLKDAHAWCLSQARKAMADLTPCVIANTFSQLWEMQPYIDEAAKLGVDVRIVTATGAWESVHKVPADVVERMRGRWEE
jgi:predicted kinase